MFCNTFNSESLFTDPKWCKNPENPSCIDLILTNKRCSFQNSSVFETRPSLKDWNCTEHDVSKLQPRIINSGTIKGLTIIILEMIYSLFRLAIASTEANDSGFLNFFQQRQYHPAP